MAISLLQGTDGSSVLGTQAATSGTALISPSTGFGGVLPPVKRITLTRRLIAVHIPPERLHRSKLRCVEDLNIRVRLLHLEVLLIEPGRRRLEVGGGSSSISVGCDREVLEIGEVWLDVSCGVALPEGRVRARGHLERSSVVDSQSTRGDGYGGVDGTARHGSVHHTYIFRIVPTVIDPSPLGTLFCTPAWRLISHIADIPSVPL
jgi:hypothetical protein